jgi:hypothetical protein
MSSFLRANGIVMPEEKHEQTTTTRAVLLDKKKTRLAPTSLVKSWGRIGGT